MLRVGSELQNQSRSFFLPFPLGADDLFNNCSPGKEEQMPREGYRVYRGALLHLGKEPADTAQPPSRLPVLHAGPGA